MDNGFTTSEALEETFVARLSNASYQTVTVDFVFSGITATSGDYIHT